MSALEVSTEPDTHRPRPGDRSPGSLSWRTVRWTALGLYAVGCVLFLELQGIPTDRVGIALAILLLLTIATLGRGWPAWWQMVRDWLPFQSVLLVYDYSRGFASPYTAEQLRNGRFPIQNVHNSLGMPLHVELPVRADEWIGRCLGMGGLPTTWLQQHLHPGDHTPWCAVPVSITYSSHFLVMPTVAVVLWFLHRERFRAWMGLVVALAATGLATYFLFPMAPPWLADSHGVLPGPRVGRYTSDGFDAIGLHMVGGALDQAQYLVNPVAAMPSLHMGFATLVAGFFWYGRRWWQRTLLAAYPVAMGVTLVYAGEHYVVDELAGVGYALAILAAWHHLASRRSRSAAPA